MRDLHFLEARDTGLSGPPKFDSGFIFQYVNRHRKRCVHPRLRQRCGVNTFLIKILKNLSLKTQQRNFQHILETIIYEGLEHLCITVDQSLRNSIIYSTTQPGHTTVVMRM